MSISENRELLSGVSRPAMSAANPDETSKPAEPANQSPSREAFNLAETAMKLGGVSPATIYRWHDKGLIKLIKIGGRTLVAASEIARLTGQSAT